MLLNDVRLNELLKKRRFVLSQEGSTTYTSLLKAFKCNIFQNSTVHEFEALGVLLFQHSNIFPAVK